MAKKIETSPDRTKPGSNDELASHDQPLNTSMRTTMPEFMPDMAGATTIPDQPDGSDVQPASDAASELPHASHGSFSGNLGRFNYLRTLGEGAFGVVVQVWDPELHAHRAIKVPHRKLIESHQVNAESYVREARKLAFLGKHPNILEVLDIQRMSDGTPFLVSEFIPGGSLEAKIKVERWTWQKAVALVAEIANAIAFAHSKGVVHRDLKPANILLTDEGKPVIVDFGLALGDDEFSYHSSVCGTYQYMSPQQIHGEADRVDGRSDIYSLGVILYQLVAGRLPYRSRDVRSLKREIIHDEPTPLRQYSPEAPAELEQICQHAMAKEPGNRYSTAADFATELRNLLQLKTGSVQGVFDNALIEPAPAARASFVRHWRPLTLAMLGCGIIGFAVYSLTAPKRSKTFESASVVTATPNLQIHFQKKDSHTYSPTLADADLPLDVGDKLQFHVAQLPKPMFTYIYRINSDGVAERLWPEKAANLDKQAPVGELSSPPADDEWWAVQKTGGALVFFLGISETPLDEKQLRDFESQTSMTRESLLDAMRRSRQPVAEFEYPAQSKTYELRNNEMYRTRGGDFHLVVSPKVYAADHSKLRKWFSAYHGWIVSTKE